LLTSAPSCEQGGDDKNILRHIPNPVVKDFVSYMTKDENDEGLAQSRLVVKYQPQDNNRRVLVPLPKVNNWEPVKKQPRSLAIKPPGQGGKTKADTPARTESEKESHAAEASAVPPAKKQAVGAAGKKPPAVGKAAGKAPVRPVAREQAQAPAPAKKLPAVQVAKPPQKQSTLQPVRKPPAPAPAPDAGDEHEDEEEPPVPVPVEYGVPRDTTVQAQPSQLYLRTLNGQEQCTFETQRITHVYEGTNESRGDSQFLIQKIVLPTSCTDYKVTVEYTIPPKQPGGRRRYA